MVANDQGDDVYRHVNFIAGSIISGNTHAAAGAILVDATQALFIKNADRRLQSHTELRNDFAGLTVGGECFVREWLRTTQGYKLK